MKLLRLAVLAATLGSPFGSSDADAAYRPAVAVQDEAAISCGTPESRDKALGYARQFGATTIRINAIQNLNPLYRCDPVGAARAVAAAGFRPHVTVVGSPTYARQLARTIGPVVDLWSVWNEPNHPMLHVGAMVGGMPASYRRVYVRVSRTLRRYDRGSRVLIGELAPDRPHEANYLGRVAGRHGRTLRADGIAVHAYMWFGDPDSIDERGMRGYLRKWNKAARGWARERRLCLPKKANRARGCRPVPIYVTEAGYMRQRETAADVPIYDTPTTADRLVRTWRVACQEKARQMFHYQLLDNGQPEWDTALIGRWGPRPEFASLVGYLRTAQGCRGRAGAMGPERGEPVAVFVPEPSRVPPVPPLPELVGVPDDIPVVVPLEDTQPLPPVPDPDLEAIPAPLPESPGPPEPATEPLAEPVVPPIEEETP